MLKLRIANKSGYHYDETPYAICNECGLICISYANNEQDALDYAVDENFMDCQLMTPEDYKEYSDNGWDDSFILAGNASEPFWSEYLSITPIDKKRIR